jgi:hypothetical protein
MTTTTAADERRSEMIMVLTRILSVSSVNGCLFWTLNEPEP